MIKIKNGVLLSADDSDVINGHFKVPKGVTSIGNGFLCYNKTLTSIDLKGVTSIGNGFLCYNETLTSIDLKGVTINVNVIDRKLFFIENTHTKEGVKIYSGYNFISMSNKMINKESCFVAEKQGFYAHGLTVKKAISDLQFKIISETLKKEPIKKDTIIDINYYRLITGACQHGVDYFIKQNGLKKFKYKAVDLLPILEKNNAYGLEKFKSLIDF